MSYVRSFAAVMLLGAAATNAGEGEVIVGIFEKVAEKDPWLVTDNPTAEYSQSSFAWNRLPKKYAEGGVIVDRSNPFLVRAEAHIELPAGEYEFLLWAKNLARLSANGETIVEQPHKLNRNADGHEVTPDLPPAYRPGLRPSPPGHHEVAATIQLAEGTHGFVLEALVGGKGLRTDLGELCVAISESDSGDFHILSPTESGRLPLTQRGWRQWQVAAEQHLNSFDTTHRRQTASQEDDYWQFRHQLAKQYYAELDPIDVPLATEADTAGNEIDHFLLQRLAEQSLAPARPVDDLAFLRRVTLDTVGVVPTLEEIQDFQSDTGTDKRARVIERLLSDDRWADHWVAYWQDVLAENPNILKASLNNTGPFRWWIYESFLDNKPFDRFATDLILMRGSRYSGGPAGFGMATQNDVPEANKALILAQAFLAENMKCARCHDSPTNDFTQKQLFRLAAMLRRKALELPASSTVSFDKEGRQPLVEASLRAGDQILPHWPLDQLATDELPAGMLRDAADPREWLAAIVTSPRNERFAKVIVNRLWHRYLGRGLISDVDDWSDAESTHPELLEFLVRTFVSDGYDIKALARLILNSQTYQRVVLTDDTDQRYHGEAMYASATRRRMTAEQVFDSLVAVSGKRTHAERLTMDPEGRRPISAFLNLGSPQRAWQFSSLSNERDRPALSLPVAQSANDLLKAFGWRESRQDPLTVRDRTMTPLQPLVLANGIMGRRLVGLSDDHAITELSLCNLPVDELVNVMFLSYLTRYPSSDEKRTIIDVLSAGYEERIVHDAVAVENAYQWQRHPVSWSNHLHPDSSTIMLELEQRAQIGDPPSLRLTADWRERMEDVLWAMANNPEFVFVP